jgi:serine/threonine-protein kinase HipA
MASVEEQFRRMLFNVVARNQDDHPKNIAFLMDKAGRWSLSPAFDMTYSYNPAGAFTSSHQMSIHGKRDGFTLDDVNACANLALLKRGSAETILDEVRAGAARWPEFAEAAKLSKGWTEQIQKTFRMELA